MATAPKFVSVPSKTLAASINSSATTIQLSDIKGWDGANLSSANFSTILWCVLRDSTNTFMELMQLDPTTIANSSITILKRGLDFSGGSTEVTANKLTWIKNDTIVELGSNPPQLLQALKDYIDGVAVAGAPNASLIAAGLVQTATQGQVDAGTATGSTGALLVVTPDIVRAKHMHDYAADAGSNASYVITVTPAPISYATGDTYLFKANTANAGVATLNVNALGAQTIKNRLGGDLSANDIAAGQIVLVLYDGTNFRMIGKEPAAKFGGTGSDGALAISAGTTTLNAAGAQYLVKNYTSISITGNAVLTISNPHANGTILILKSQGAVTITSNAAAAIDMRSMGGAGGAIHAGPGNDGTGIGTYPIGGAGGNGFAAAWSSSVAGLYGAIARGGIGAHASPVPNKNIAVFAGAGGGTGSDHANTGGVGGTGGGGVYIECGGALNITSTINCSGAVGSAGTGTSGSGVAGSGGQGGGGNVNAGIPAGSASGVPGDGGGGGGGGAVVIIYSTLTGNTGTYTVTGGSAGAGAAGGNAGTDGGAGYSVVLPNTELF